MIIKEFKVEQWMNEFEEDATYNIAETCVDSITLRELLEISGEKESAFIEMVMNKRMTYGHINGSPEFKQGVCGLYENIAPNQVLSTHGAIGANHLVMYSLVEKGDEVISVLPTYQQHYSIPESFGAEVKILKLEKERDFLPDLEQLEKMVSKRTKLININNPNNPTGALMPEAMLKRIVEIARSVDAYILCDEVYRGLNQKEHYTKSIVDLYEKGISVSSMSKVFSLAGLRMGWIVSPSAEVMKKCSEHRDYNMISCGILDEIFSGLALKNADKVLERNQGLVRKNLEILDHWVKKYPEITYFKPQAGTTALLYYTFDMLSREFCIKLMKEKGALLTPGSCFELEKCVRIGYACNTNELIEGLAKLGEFIEDLRK